VYLALDIFHRKSKKGPKIIKYIPSKKQEKYHDSRRYARKGDGSFQKTFPLKPGHPDRGSGKD